MKSCTQRLHQINEYLYELDQTSTAKRQTLAHKMKALGTSRNIETVSHVLFMLLYIKFAMKPKFSYQIMLVELQGKMCNLHCTESCTICG